MALRTPRGYDSDTKPAFLELLDGQRPAISRVSIPPYYRLPIFDMDNFHDDPIVLPAGTLIGVKHDGTGHSSCISGNSEGLFVPSSMQFDAYPGANTDATNFVAVGTTHTSDESTFGISITGWQAPVYPIGVVFKPTYIFNPRYEDYQSSAVGSDGRTRFTNYKREHVVSFLTDWLIQVPARTPLEHEIRPGDTVMASTYLHWNNDQTVGTYTNGSAGTFMAVDSLATSDFTGGLSLVPGNSGTNTNLTSAMLRLGRVTNCVVGKCLSVTVIGSDSSGVGNFLWSALANNRFTRAQYSTIGLADKAQLHATSEFAALEKVQTVPSGRLSGSGTAGVPGWLAGTFGARADANGIYRMLTILLRIV